MSEGCLKLRSRIFFFRDKEEMLVRTTHAHLHTVHTSAVQCFVKQQSIFRSQKDDIPDKNRYMKTRFPHSLNVVIPSQILIYVDSLNHIWLVTML